TLTPGLSARRCPRDRPPVTGPRWCAAAPGAGTVTMPCTPRRASPSAPGLAVAAHDELLGGELAQAHRPTRVPLLRGDADLRADPELLAGHEPGGGVDHHRRGVDLPGEAVGRRQVAGDDGLAVAGAVPPDVGHGIVERRH